MEDSGNNQFVAQDLTIFKASNYGIQRIMILIQEKCNPKVMKEVRM